MGRPYKIWSDSEKELLQKEARAKGETEKTWDKIGELFGVTGAAARNQWKLIRKKSGELRSTGHKKEEPTHQQLFNDLKDKRVNLSDLCNKYDRAPNVIQARIESMEIDGYYIVANKAKSTITIPTISRPQVEIPEISIASLMGDEFSIGVWSDLQAGSNTAQPTALNSFLNYCYYERGIRQFFQPGDFSQGIYGYKGLDKDLIPSARPFSRGEAHYATRRQVNLAELYVPQWDDATHYMLGGNHDWWHVTATGLDPLRMLCDRRDDMIYMGYDIASVQLTDMCHLRMWHPTGGVAYAKSYKMQRKGIEPQSLEALRNAMRLNESPKVSVLLQGHDHIAFFLPSAPIYGVACGAFQGQTNYLKRKGLFPDIGGTILTFKFGDDGRIAQIGYEWTPYQEIENDWENWPTPEIPELNFGQEELDVIFELKEKGKA